jgi:hypothetical protein
MVGMRNGERYHFKYIGIRSLVQPVVVPSRIAPHAARARTARWQCCRGTGRWQGSVFLAYEKQENKNRIYEGVEEETSDYFTYKRKRFTNSDYPNG